MTEIAWVTPPTFVSGNALTAAQLNILSGDLNETAPAKFTAAGQILVSTAANTGAVRAPDSANIGTNEGTASQVFQNVATVGPEVTVTTGTKALTIVRAFMYNSTAGQNSFMSYTVTGATTIAALEDHSASASSTAVDANYSISEVYLREDLNAGSNTFQAKYKVGGGTGWWRHRRISVIPF